jgi:hypothetical protein
LFGPRRQPRGHRKAVQVGKLNVEQNDLRSEPLDRGERLGAVGGFTDDREPLCLEQRARRLAEIVVVVHDQHGRAHALIVAEAVRDRIVASRNRIRRDGRVSTERRLWPAPFRARPPARNVGRRESSTDEGRMMRRLTYWGGVMRQSLKLRLSALLVLSATAAVMLAAGAAAQPPFKERFHDEGTFVEEDFCGAGLTVDGTFVVDGSLLVVAHGPDGLAYFLEHISQTTTFTNRANGKTVTFDSIVVNKDLRVTDNGDGTLTILGLRTGNDVFYGPDGNVIGRNPGQIRVEILVDHSGTPSDPSDDVELDFRLVRESTGRSDDFCEVAVPALS